ncbi:MAG: trypsin-like peptidase domain-containing protein [bacterium]
MKNLMEKKLQYIFNIVCIILLLFSPSNINSKAYPQLNPIETDSQDAQDFDAQDFDIAEDDDNDITTYIPNWAKVQKRAKDTVVQVFSQVSEFNWEQPYKTPDQSSACGTGFFIYNQGHLLTNFHVIDEAVSIKIQIPTLGKERFTTKVIGVCPERDLALLKLTDISRTQIINKLGKISHLNLGNSDIIRRTNQILALGYPLSQEKLKSTQGIVSGRENIDNESYIQITAAINKGNSGGPSLNSKGEVIGINTCGVSKAQSVGYIIPINDIKNVIKDLHKVRLLRKPSFGCIINKGTKELVKFLNNPEPGGLYVSHVFKNTLLEKAGIQAGDMIYSINSRVFDLYGETQVSWAEDKVPATALVNRLKLGEKIGIDFYRNGERKITSFNFDLQPELPIRTIYPEYEKVDYEIIGGLVIMELSLNHIDIFQNKNPMLIKYTKREHQYKSRLIITHILPNSQAQQARVISKAAIIKKINGIPVNTLADLRAAVITNKEFLSIATENKEFMVLSMKKIIKQEDALTKRYFYKKSEIFKAFEPEPEILETPIIPETQVTPEPPVPPTNQTPIMQIMQEAQEQEVQEPN